MAVYFNLAVACADESGTAAINAHFEGLTLVLEDGLTIPCRTRPLQDGEGGWWSEVRPVGASIGAWLWDGVPEPDLANREQRSEIGRRLYQHLMNAPAFRCAAWGCEMIDDFFNPDIERLTMLHEASIVEYGWDGLVVDEEIWERAHCPKEYVPFRPGYFWRPYRGEVNW